MFYWFYPVLLDGESKFYKRKAAEAQSISFFEHRLHRFNG